MGNATIDNLMNFTPPDGRVNATAYLEREHKVIAALVRKSGTGEDMYIFVYDDNKDNRAEALRTCGRFASDPEYSFTWFDAAELSKVIRLDSRSYSGMSYSEMIKRRFQLDDGLDS